MTLPNVYLDIHW